MAVLGKAEITISDILDGKDGAAGKGIKSIAEKYAVSSSNSTAPTTWYDSVQTMTSTNKYLWNYEIVTYTDNTTSTTAKRVIGVYGDKGQTGNNGATGPTGKGIKTITNYYLVTSASSGVTTSTSGWTTTPGITTTTNKYLWNYEKVTYTDNSTTSTTPHIIGTHGATGAAGKGIKSVTNYYLASASGSGVTASTSGWTTTIQSITATNKYLWNYEKITYTDNSTATTSPCIIGVYGDKGNTGNTGATGNGIKSITEYYQISTSNTTAPTSWVTTVPTLTATNKYLWNYEKITYTNGTSVDTAKRVIGVYGDKGNTGATGPAGKGIKSTAITYQASTSGTTAPTGTWNTSVPSVPQGQYLWSRTVITYTDNSTSTTYSVAYIPKNGQNGATGSTGPTGATGTGVASIVQQYYLSTSKTSQTGGSWVTSMPTWSSGKYLWTRYQINYKNPTSTSYTTPVCDSSWEAVNDIQVGGRNLLLNSDFSKGTNPWAAESGTLEVDADDIQGQCLIINPNNKSRAYYNAKNIWKEDQVYSYSFMAKASVDGVTIQPSRSIADYSETKHLLTTEWGRYEGKIKSTLTADAGTLSITVNHSETTNPKIYIAKIKLEYGNKATDWTPAPEDVQADIDEAAKTATNYMEFTSGAGLQIGDKTNGSWKGFRSRITSTAFEILNEAGSAVASYGRKLIQLGKDSVDAVIELCGGKGIIKHENVGVYGETKSTLTVNGVNLGLLADDSVIIRSEQVDSDNTTYTSQIYMTKGRIDIATFTELEDGTVISSNGVDIDDNVGMDIGVPGETETALSKARINGRSLLDFLHPVGSIYMSTNATNPTNLFGGTWVAWGAGRVPVGFNGGDGNFNSSEKTGGSKTINISHSHTVNSHAHIGTVGYDENNYYTSNAFGSTARSYNGYAFSAQWSALTNPVRLSYTSPESPGTNAQLSGSQSILQPYITCYMWKRTA